MVILWVVWKSARQNTLKCVVRLGDNLGAEARRNLVHELTAVSGHPSGDETCAPFRSRATIGKNHPSLESGVLD